MLDLIVAHVFGEYNKVLSKPRKTASKTRIFFAETSLPPLTDAAGRAMLELY